MQEAILTSKGQITLPKQLRNELQVQQGDKIFFLRTTSGYRLFDEKARQQMVKRNRKVLEETRKRMDGLAEALGVKDDDDVIELVKAYRREKYKCEY